MGTALFIVHVKQDEIEIAICKFIHGHKSEAKQHSEENK